MKEKELIAALDEHDALIVKCAKGEMDFIEFDKAYNSFYQTWALDGHEATYQVIRIVTRYAERIKVHRRVWDEVLIQVCSDDNAELAEYRDAGRFGSKEAVLRINKIADEAGLLNNKPAE